MSESRAVGGFAVFLFDAKGKISLRFSGVEERAKEIAREAMDADEKLVKAIITPGFCINRPAVTFLNNGGLCG